jgi:hypothetical protein
MLRSHPPPHSHSPDPSPEHSREITLGTFNQINRLVINSLQLFLTGVPS